MSKERYQTRLARDKAELLEQYKKERDISNAEAVRRMVDVGLAEYVDGDAEGGEVIPGADGARPGGERPSGDGNGRDRRVDGDAADTAESAAPGGTERLLRDVAAIYAAFSAGGLVAAPLTALDVVGFGLSPVEWLIASAACVFVFVTCSAVIATQLPARVDSALSDGTDADTGHQPARGD